MTGAFGLDGRCAIVTGAAGGIGRAVAELFAQEGASLVLADINADGLAATASGLSTKCLPIALDVSEEENWLRALEQISPDLGPVTILVNAAGVVISEPILQMSVASYAAQIRVNQDGTFLGMRTTAPLIAENGGGAIVNISSIAALRGYPNNLAYAASKTAVLSMSKSAAHEFAPLGIRVNSVSPGIIDTPMIKGDRDEAVRLPGRMGRPEEVARVIAFLASDLSNYVTGAELLIDGGITLGGAS